MKDSLSKAVMCILKTKGASETTGTWDLSRLCLRVTVAVAVGTPQVFVNLSLIGAAAIVGRCDAYHQAYDLLVPS